MTSDGPTGGEPSFFADDVCRAAGIKRSTLNTWRARKIRGTPDPILPMVKAEKMGWTRYSEADALRVCVLARLVRSGVDLGLAAQVTGGLAEYGVFEKALASTTFHLVVFNIGLNLDDDRKPKAAGYETRWHESRAKALRSALKAVEDDSATLILVDLGKIVRSTLAALREENR